jgi:HTH-type transcriptional regulator, sugar sensing transcriptional regulator
MIVYSLIIIYYFSVVEKYLTVFSHLLIRKQKKETPMEDIATNQITLQLKGLGLTTHEALTYITLLTHPNMTANAICNETKIPDSKIYYALDSLSKKGMITIQQSKPSIFRAMSPSEAITNLKQQLKDEFEQKIKQADSITSKLTPLYDSAEKPEELEIAYILRGQKTIVNRMKALIQNSKREITMFMILPEVLKEIHPALLEAKEKRRVKLNIAVTPDVAASQSLSDLGDLKVLHCNLAMLISDMKTLVTLTNWPNEVALMTQDEGIIRAGRDYYDNPRCCC